MDEAARHRALHSPIRQRARASACCPPPPSASRASRARLPHVSSPQHLVRGRVTLARRESSVCVLSSYDRPTMETTSGRSESDPSSWPTLDEFKQLSVEGKSAAYGTARTEGFNSQKRLRTLEQHTDARFARLEKTLGHFEVTNAKLQARIEEQDGAIRKQNKTINEQSASIEHLNKINKEQSASISHLNKINKEQSASISHLNKINREQSASIERLKKINKEQSASISHLMERDSINQLTIERQGMSVAAWMSDYTSVRDDNRELNRSMRELTAKYNELKRRVDDLTATS